MSGLRLGPIAGSPFAEIAAATWGTEVPPNLRVASNVGWLVCADAHDQIAALVGFSVEAIDESASRNGVLLPPATIAEVQERLGPPKVSRFNTDGTAKGLGSYLLNTPAALQPHSIRSPEIAVRSVPLTHEDDVHTRIESIAPFGRAWRFGRHGLLVGLSAALDALPPKDKTRGTAAAVRYMEKNYGSARLVHMPDLPPIWQTQQRKAGVRHEISPQAVLVRGGRFAASNPMTRIGSYPVSHMQRG